MCRVEYFSAHGTLHCGSITRHEHIQPVDYFGADYIDQRVPLQPQFDTALRYLDLTAPLSSLFSHLPRVAPPYTLEPFWHQLPSGSRHNHTAHHRLGDTPDDPPVNWRSTGQCHEMSAPEQRLMRRARYPPVELVDIFVDGVRVRTLPLRLVVRFSQKAAELFPRPKRYVYRLVQPLKQRPRKAAPHHVIQPAAAEMVFGWRILYKTCADRSTHGFRSDVERPTSGERTGTPEADSQPAAVVSERNITATDPVVQPARLHGKLASPGRNIEDWIASQEPGNKELHLGVHGVKEYPSVEAVTRCVDWMNSNRKVHDELPLVPLLDDRAEACSLHALVDLYAAVVCFGLRPKPMALREKIMKRLTLDKPLVEDIVYIHERIPADDTIVKRMVTSYCEHRENGQYTDVEVAAIKKYVLTQKALCDHFADVQQLRYDKMKARKLVRQKRDQEQAKESMRRAWKDLEEALSREGARPQRKDRPAAFTEQVHGGEAKATGPGHRRRTRRKADGPRNGAQC